MQRLDLKKYKDLLGIEDKAAEIGLTLSSYGVHGKGQGEKLFKEDFSNLEKRLPYLFYDIQKIGEINEKIKKLEDNVENGKNRRDYFINNSKGEKILTGIADMAVYSSSIMILARGQTNPLITTLALVNLWSLLAFAQALVSNPMSDLPYLGPASPIKAIIDACSYKPRKKNLLKKAERKKAKLEKEIKPKIAQAMQGKLEYTEDWLNKEEQGLEEMLLSAQPEFAERFTRLQQITRPEDQLKFLKHFEEFAKHLEQDSWNKEKVEQHLQRYKITKGSGIWTKEAKKAFAKKLQEREKHFNMLLKPVQELPKNPGAEELAKKFEKTATVEMEYHLQKYKRISENRKDVLRQLYKERPGLAWTAKCGELDRLTRDRRKSTKKQKTALALIFPAILFWVPIVGLGEKLSPLFYSLLGLEPLLTALPIMVGRKDNRAQREIRDYLWLHEPEPEEQNN